MKRIDTHQHLWDLEQFPCAWCKSIPALNRSFQIDDYLTAAQGAGIEKTIFVECDVDEPNSFAEARYIQKLSESQPIIAGIVAAARPERDDFAAQLNALLELPKLRGIRRVLHVVPDGISQTALFAKNIQLLAAHQLTFDVCVLTRQLPLAINLVRKCPEVQFVLDHCGVPDVKGGAFDPWRGYITEIAAFPNVACKISGIVAYAAADWKVEDLLPWVQHVVDNFGWDRVMWGADWPVCTLTASLKRWTDASDNLFSAASPIEREKVFYKNAERIYRV